MRARPAATSSHAAETDRLRRAVELASRRRAELWREAGNGGRETARAEIAALEARLDALWVRLRSARVRSVEEEPATIRRRAALDVRLEHELDRRIRESSRSAASARPAVPCMESAESGNTAAHARPRRPHDPA